MATTVWHITLKRFIPSSVAVVIPKTSAWVNSNGAAVRKRMCVQREREWKYAPQANALTWITKTHINSQRIRAEDGMRLRLHRSIRGSDTELYACHTMDNVFEGFWGEKCCGIEEDAGCVCECWWVFVCIRGSVCARKHAFVWWGLRMDAFYFVKAVGIRPDSSIVFSMD